MCSVLSSRDKNLVFFPPHFPFPGLPSPVVSGCLRLAEELFQRAVAESTAVCVFTVSPVTAGVLSVCVTPKVPGAGGCWPRSAMLPGWGHP